MVSCSAASRGFARQSGGDWRRHIGVNAARMAIGLEADVTILEVDVERMRFLDFTLHTVHTLYSNQAHILELLPTTDLLIGAVLLPARKRPS